jgi:hypothetical protein
MNRDEELKVQQAWCSACDRKVHVTVHPRVAEEGREAKPEDLICLEHGERCTGDLCPIFEVPSKEMKRRYEELLSRGREDPR